MKAQHGCVALVCGPARTGLAEPLQRRHPTTERFQTPREKSGFMAGVSPWGGTVSCGNFDRLAGLLLLEALGADVSERRV